MTAAEGSGTVELRGLRAGGWYRRVLGIVFIAAAYYLGAWIGLQLALVHEQITPLWPPTGVALVCLLLLGVRCWPGIAIGAFLANVAIGPTLPAVAIITVGNTLAPVVACLLLTNVGFRVRLDRLKDALSLVFLGALAPMLISATVGTCALWIGGALAWRDYWGAWLVWWTGDAMGVLVIAPVLLVASVTSWRLRATPLRWLEAVALPVAAFGVIVLANQTATPMFFLAFPILIWAALRFEQRGAAPAAFVMSMAAVLGAVRDTGPFAGLDLVPKMITLQAFNASTALTGLLLAAVTTERKLAMLAVERAVGQLADAVTALEPYRLLRGGVLDGVLRTPSSPTDQR